MKPVKKNQNTFNGLDISFRKSFNFGDKHMQTNMQQVLDYEHISSLLNLMASLKS
jgi:hypothetical protein